MVRMWMVNPKVMCRNHLLGEHRELHMLMNHYIKKRYSISGFLKSNCIQPKSIISRHNALVNEMKKRNYNHNSHLPNYSIDYLPKEEQEFEIDRKKSALMLMKKCESCKKRIHKYYELNKNDIA